MNELPRLRKHQEAILRQYRSGMMGISAVPGSGKTYTLSYLAANLIQAGLEDDQEILVVTLVNSAVDNFYRRVGDFLEHRGAIPVLGYRVRTLHGLAHDIIRERPELAGLENQFTICDEREAADILDDCIHAWFRSNSDRMDDYLAETLEESRKAYVKKEQLPLLLRDMAGNFIRYAKDYRASPEKLAENLSQLPVPLPLAEFGTAIYSNYQRALAYRGAVDFDDLIRLSLQILESDEDFLQRLRRRWPFILEDEAQDSSKLQEEILSILSGPTGNWVRVGDPNQAIYETFTTANPLYLRAFFTKPNVQKFDLPSSSRSTQSIIHLANQLINWTMHEHPLEPVREALQTPFIQPVEPGENPPNPEDNPLGIHLVDRKQTPEEEVSFVVRSLERWLPEHPKTTVSILAPRNQRAFDLVDALRRKNIPYNDDLLRSSTSTRTSAGALTYILRYLSDPQSSQKLASVFKVWRREDRKDAKLNKRDEQIAESIRKCKNLETYLYPHFDVDWLKDLSGQDPDSTIIDILSNFRDLINRWHAAVLLPIDQLILTLAQDIFTQPADLAIAQKLASLLKQTHSFHRDWHLPELTEELAIIAKNERRFLGFSNDESGFDPNLYQGKVVVATIHKAKGLEWDRVYLMSVNNYDFPSGSIYDTYMSEKWYFRERLNLDAEALAQLDILIDQSTTDWYEEGKATAKARLNYIRERLRLLYVGITRAKQELIITWNTGRRGDAKEALPLIYLTDFWQQFLVKRTKEE